MMASLGEQYCSTWRAILSEVAEWEASDVDKFIDGMLLMMELEDSLVFHELPSTWAAWAMFPITDTRTAEASRNAQSAFCQSVHALHGGNELATDVDWRKLRAVYKELASQVRAIQDAFPNEPKEPPY